MILVPSILLMMSSVVESGSVPAVSDSSRTREYQFLRQASLERNDLAAEDFETLDPLYKLIYLARKGLADDISVLLKKDEFNNVVNDTDNTEKYTPLMWAAVAGHTKTVQILIQHPEVNINGRGGWVSLF